MDQEKIKVIIEKHFVNAWNLFEVNDDFSNDHSQYCYCQILGTSSML